MNITFWSMIICLIIFVNTSNQLEFVDNEENEIETRMIFNTRIRSCENDNGRCMPRLQCKLRGGIVAERCLLPFIYCCKSANQSCGGTTSNKVSYFTSEKQPKGQCSLHIKPSSRKICQIRIDFEEFSLSQPQPRNGSAFECVDDTFVITTNSENHLKFPALCGENTGQHLYIPVNTTSISNIITTLTFTIADRTDNSSTEVVNPKWKLKITQLECLPEEQSLASSSGRDFTIKSDFNRNDLFLSKSDLLAPSGCSQYYTEKDGVYESFNYNNGVGPYMGNLHYSICFQRSPAACGIRHTPVTFQLGYNTNVTNGTERDCDTKIADHPLIEDYLLIPNGQTTSGTKASKFCDDALASNNSVISLIPAPFYVVFKSGTELEDVNDSQRGFRIRYATVTTGC